MSSPYRRLSASCQHLPISLLSWGGAGDLPDSDFWGSESLKEWDRTWMVEHREATRYLVRVPVIFTLHNGEEITAGGFTRDVSALGIYVLCDRSQCPSPGSALSVEVLLPPLETNIHSLQLRAEGRTVRINGPNEQSGFALATNLGGEPELTTLRE